MTHSGSVSEARWNSEGNIQASYAPVTHNTQCLVALSMHVLLFTLSPMYMLTIMM